jgi:hypothetical protein
MTAAPSGSDVRVDRWYRAPRNPVLESPGVDAIVEGDQLLRPERYLVYGEASAAPRDETKLGFGTIHTFRHGLVFVPERHLERDPNLELLKSAALMLATPLVFDPGNALLDSVRDAGLDIAMNRERNQEQALRERLADPNLFLFAWIDVVESIDGITRGKSLMPSWVRRATVRVVDDQGTERGWTFTRPAKRDDTLVIDRSLPLRFFTLRANAERERLAHLVASVVSGADERLRARLAAIGVDIQGRFVTDRAIRDGIRRGLESGRLMTVKLAALRDALADPAATDVRIDWAAWSHTCLELLAPVVAEYREQPNLALLVEQIEAIGRGETDETFRPTIRPEDHPTNLVQHA